MTMIVTFCSAIRKMDGQKYICNHQCNFSLHIANTGWPATDFTWVFLSHVHSGFVCRYWPLYFLKCPRTFIDVFLNPLLCGFYFCFTLLWNESLHIPSITMTNTIAAPEHMVQPKKGLSCRSVSVWITYHTVPRK